MKKRFSAVIVISLAFLFPSSINTQWHTNGFLNFPGPVVLEAEDRIFGFGLQDAPLRTRDYLAVDLSMLALPWAAPSGFTFETRIFLNETQAPATLLALGNAEANHLSFQLRKEPGQSLVAEFNGATTIAAKLFAPRALAADEWLELAVVYEHAATDARHARLYLNGECVAVTTLTEDWHWPEAATLFLGGIPSGKTFSGKLDEVRLSNLARYHEASYPVAQTLVADAYTLGLWHFEQEELGPALTSSWRSNANGARLSEFTASRHQLKTICLEWRTAYEHGVEGFELERREGTSTGTFARCGYMPALGTSQQAQHYRFIDAPPKPGVYYYRLRALDQNGDRGFSKEVACAVGEEEPGLE
ncbi:MAG: LamG domain-containing protein [candidate division KSB1 bacterium]